MSSDPLILNAEQYVGADDFRPTARAKKVKQTPTLRSGRGPRKRARTSSKPVAKELVVDEEEVGEDEGEEEEEEEEDDVEDACVDADEKSKRARGRPRLDTKDQNAAERRRTQIRLAQRAYRSRKENAIQTLEDEVRILHEKNEEMRNAFMTLHDFAINRKIPEKVPMFAQELQSAREKFVRLTQKPSESSGPDSLVLSTGKQAENRKRSLDKQSKKPSSPGGVKALPTTMVSSVWGYTISNEPQREATPTMSNLPPTPAAQLAMAQVPMGHEVITMPTLENASFPFDQNAQDSFFSQGHIRPIHQQSSTPNITPPIFSPSISLPMPLSMSYTESTFGRRLQRDTIEFACRLSTMANPPTDKFAKVFGFCLLFEPFEKIRARLHEALEKTRHESLHNWRVPFWALGGMGQHQFGGQQGHHQAKPIGNQGTVDVAKHNFGTNFGIGPFDAGTTDARDRQLDATMRIMMPGFQGDFFDPDEVELYLQSCGVCIQPGQDYVTAEVDVAWLDGLQRQQAKRLVDTVGGGGDGDAADGQTIGCDDDGGGRQELDG